MTVLYLYAEVMGYTIATLRQLSKQGASVHVVHWDKQKISPFQFSSIEGIAFYPRSQMNLDKIMELAKNINPQITVISGWMDKDYLKVAAFLRKKKNTVVVTFDNHWQSSIKQRLAALVFKAGVKKKYFSHSWVAGYPQYEYGKRIGFSKSNIVFELYSADIENFGAVYEERQQLNSLPHKFLYVGRFETVKGLDILLHAWNQLRDMENDWELHLIGHGSLQSKINGTKVIVHDFKQPKDLAASLKDYGCFILPSIKEPWGVAVHEMAAAGFPLILSNAVGSGSAFLINGYNGFNFQAGDSSGLAEQMKKIIKISDDELIKMGERSHLLAQRITPETSAANLLALTKNNI